MELLRENNRLREVNTELLAALKRAERDLLALMGDDAGKIDPAFARERVRAAIAKAEQPSMSELRAMLNEPY